MKRGCHDSLSPSFKDVLNLSCPCLGFQAISEFVSMFHMKEKLSLQGFWASGLRPRGAGAPGSVPVSFWLYGRVGLHQCSREPEPFPPAPPWSLQLRELEDKYAECMEMLHEAQEELKNLRNKTVPNTTSRRYHSLGLFPMVRAACFLPHTGQWGAGGRRRGGAELAKMASHFAWIWILAQGS